MERSGIERGGDVERVGSVGLREGNVERECETGNVEWSWCVGQRGGPGTGM